MKSKSDKSDDPVAAKGEIAAKPKEDQADGEGSRRRSWTSWMLGWVALPGAVLGGIFAGGALVGANFHEHWITRAFVWVFS